MDPIEIIFFVSIFTLDFKVLQLRSLKKRPYPHFQICGSDQSIKGQKNCFLGVGTKPYRLQLRFQICSRRQSRLRDDFRLKRMS